MLEWVETHPRYTRYTFAGFYVYLAISISYLISCQGGLNLALTSGSGICRFGEAAVRAANQQAARQGPDTFYLNFMEELCFAK